MASSVGLDEDEGAGDIDWGVGVVTGKGGGGGKDCLRTVLRDVFNSLISFDRFEI